jgi:hypothetical protein
MFCFKPKVML